MVGVRTGLRRLVLRDLEAGTGKLTEASLLSCGPRGYERFWGPASMVGVWTGLRALVLRGLEASTGRVTEGVSGEPRPSKSMRRSGG